MLPETWNKTTYQEYLNYLKSISEEEYKNFHSKLCFTKYQILGIRVPIMRKIAKNISKSNIEEFLKLCGNTYYEEVFIEGLVISNIKDEDIFIKYFSNYINKIDNWGICDTFCNSLKIINKNPSKYFSISKKLSLNEEEFISRVGLIIILNFFVEEKYLDCIYEILNTISSTKYYVNMAESWLICELYIKFPSKTESFLLKNNLNDFTHNKAISKIRESYRVCKEKKEYLNTLKRR